MHFYARLLRRVAPFASAAEEVADLRRVLAASAAVQRVKSIEPHGKGGYGVTMDFSMDGCDEFFEHLVKAGWTCVI